MHYCKANLYDKKPNIDIGWSMDAYSFKTFVLVYLKADFVHTDKFKKKIKPFLLERKQKGFFVVRKRSYIRFWFACFRNDYNLRTCHSFQLFPDEFLESRSNYEESVLLADLNRAIEDSKPREVKMCFNFVHFNLRCEFKHDILLADKLQEIRGSTWERRIFHLNIPDAWHISLMYLCDLFKILQTLEYKAFY